MGHRKQLPLGGATILAVSLLLPGCLPLPLTLAFDGISYAASGKTISDHFLSSMVQKDCSVGRALTSDHEVCLDDGADDLTIIVEQIDDSDGIGLVPASGDEEDLQGRF